MFFFLINYGIPAAKPAFSGHLVSQEVKPPGLRSAFERYNNTAFTKIKPKFVFVNLTMDSGRVVVYADSHAIS